MIDMLQDAPPKQLRGVFQDRCTKCQGVLVYLDRGVVCSTCGDPVPADHPLQVALTAEWKAADERAKVDAERRYAGWKAEEEKRAAALEQAQKAMEAAGGKIGSLTAIVSDVDYRVSLELVLPRSVFVEVGKEITRREAAIGDAALAEFLTCPEVQKVQRLRQQLATTTKECADTEKAADAADREHKAAFESGKASTDTRDRLAKCRAAVVILRADLDNGRELLAAAEMAADKAYHAHWQRHESDQRAKQEAASAKAEFAYLETALPGLPEFLTEKLILRNLLTTGIEKRGLRKPLVIPEAAPEPAAPEPRKRK